MFQTAGLPPRRGSTILANMGWTRNSSVDATKVVVPKVQTANRYDTTGVPARRDMCMDVQFPGGEPLGGLSVYAEAAGLSSRAFLAYNPILRASQSPFG